MAMAPSFLVNVFDPFSPVPWDPYLAMIEARNELGPSDGMVEYARANIDWIDTPEAHVFQADLPGMMKEDVKVEMEDGRVLKISGVRVKDEKKGHRYLEERRFGRFLRRFRLPENAKLEQVEAVMNNGVLTVTVPKREMKPQVRDIAVAA